jgi:hypothetical protein
MIEIIVTHKLVRVKSPYHPEFPPLARALQGEWDKETKRWTFPADLEEDVRDLLIEIYGTDSDDYEAVNVEYVITDVCAAKTKIFALGRQLVSRSKFNSPVRLGKGVSVQRGDFPTTGGSPVRPHLGGKGTVLLVEAVPLLVAQQAEAAAPEFIKIC